MYTLPGNHVLDAFVDKTLVSISILSNLLRFDFEDGPMLTVENTVKVIAPTGKVACELRPPLSGGGEGDFDALISQLDRRVTGYAKDEKETDLTLDFDGSGSCVFMGSDERYECYQFSWKGELYIV